MLFWGIRWNAFGRLFRIAEFINRGSLTDQADELCFDERIVLNFEHVHMELVHLLPVLIKSNKTLPKEQGGHFYAGLGVESIARIKISLILDFYEK